MSTTTTLGDRNRAARQRDAARRRHPSQRDGQVARRHSTPPPASFYVVAVVATVFTLLGLVMVLSATSVAQFHRGNSPWRVFQRQAMWAGFGGMALWLMMRLPLRRLRGWVGMAVMVSLALMLLPFVPGIGATVNGARAWVEVANLTFQPSELIKLTLLLQCAHLLAGKASQPPDVGRAMAPVAIIGGLGAGLSVLQGDLGSAIVLTGIVFAMLFVAGAPMPILSLGGLLAGLTGVLFVVSSPRRLDRFTAFLDVAAHRDNLSYQTWQAMIATAQGGLTGAGVGRGDSTLGEFVPLAHSDFIFAVIAEELGMIGIVAVLGGFLALIFAGTQIALATPDRYHSTIAAGIVAWFSLQTIINVGGVIGLLPVTGLTLPFFSAGGSSLLVTLAATGLLLNIGRGVR